MTSEAAWMDSVRRWKFLRVLGLGALVAEAVTLAVWLVIIAVVMGPSISGSPVLLPGDPSQE